jgi:hypothetical protein
MCPLGTSPSWIQLVSKGTHTHIDPILEPSLVGADLDSITAHLPSAHPPLTHLATLHPPILCKHPMLEPIRPVPLTRDVRPSAMLVPEFHRAGVSAMDKGNGKLKPQTTHILLSLNANSSLRSL